MHRSKESRPVLALYDGDCGICEAYARRVRALWGDRLRVIPSQAFDDERLSKMGLTRLDVNAAFAVQLASGQVLMGVHAIHKTLALTPSVAFLLTLAERIPLIAAAETWVYCVIAKRRAMLSAMLGLRACSLGSRG